MRAIDANVLVRLLVRDDKSQAATAEAFVAKGAWVSHLVLAETVWVLDAVNERTPQQIELALERLLSHQAPTVQDADVVATGASIAFPAYQEYTIRAQVVEAFSLASELKGSIQEFRKDRGRMPANNAEAGVPAPQYLIGNYVTRIEVQQGALTVEFGNNANSNLTGKKLTLQPLVVTGSPTSPMSWRCGLRAIPQGMETVGENRTDLDRQHVPASCRG